MTMEARPGRLAGLCGQWTEDQEFPSQQVNWFRAWNTGQCWWTGEVGALMSRGEGPALSAEELLRLVVREDRTALLASWLEVFDRKRYTALYRVRVGEETRWIEERGWFSLDGEEPCTFGVIREVTRLCQEVQNRCGPGEGVLGSFFSQEKSLVQMMCHDYFNCLVHDLKGPISTALASLQMLEYRFRQEFPQEYGRDYRKYCGFIDQSCHRLLLSVTDLWDTGQLNREDGRLSFGQWDLEQIVREAAERCRPYWGSRKVTVTIEGEGDALLACDREKVVCILFKLLANGIRSTTRDGTIRMTVIKRKTYLQVEVEDDGSPIPQQTLDRLFAYPFLPGAQFVRDGLGIGLGMWLAQLLVRLHDGHIWAVSREEGGNRFVFTLARAPAAAADAGGNLLRDQPEEQQLEQRLRMEMSVLPMEEAR